MSAPAGLAAAELERIWAGRPGILGFLTAVNHKRIGLRFIWTAAIFLLIGGVEALLLRLQLAQPDGAVLGPDTYNQLFTMHGTTMMFLFAVPMLEGLAMYVVPLQLGARDMPLPRLNAFGYWAYLFGGILLHVSFLTGQVPDGGWFAYTPLTNPTYSPGPELDFWLLGVTFVEISGIIGALEMVVLILRYRAAGMSLGRMPLFSWSALIMSGMMLLAFPFVVVASSLLEVERKFGAPFYDPAGGGDPLLWQHLFWIFGHPEVYIMLLPAIGMVSAVVAVHVQRRIVGYRLLVASLAAIAIASFGLWVHHMYAVGLPVLVLSLFAVASYFIAVPSGIQVFAWIATIWEGRPRWRTPLWFVLGFIFIFVLGGITGVMVATAPFDAQAHDSFFVVAHFHYVLIGGVVFPIFAALHHWLPKLSGRTASERAGKTAFWLMFIGFNVTFFPQHWVGLQGMVRRIYTYPAGLGWEGPNMVSTVGAFILAAGIVLFLGNLLHGWRNGAVAGADPWQGDSLEWSTSSPPSNQNFTVLPTVASLSPLWDPDESYPDERTAEAVEILSRPDTGRREVLRTTVVEAVPEAVDVLPGPTYWPFLTALSVTVSLVGLLVDADPLTVLGGLAALACVLGWGTTGHPAVEGEVPMERREAERHLAELTTPGRGGAWWGVVVGLVAIGTIVGALVYSYGYLRLGVPQWPPEGTPTRSLLLPAVAFLLVGVSGLLTVRGGRATTLLGLLVGAAGVVVHLVELAGTGYRPDADAYQAIVLVLDITAVSLFVTGLIAGAAVLAMGEEGGRRRAALAWWRGTAILWVLAWATVHFGARVL